LTTNNCGLGLEKILPWPWLQTTGLEGLSLKALAFKKHYYQFICQFSSANPYCIASYYKHTTSREMLHVLARTENRGRCMLDDNCHTSLKTVENHKTRQMP